jgi:tetratricopeptide (TPR) repeat protein
MAMAWVLCAALWGAAVCYGQASPPALPMPPPSLAMPSAGAGMEQRAPDPALYPFELMRLQLRYGRLKEAEDTLAKIEADPNLVAKLGTDLLVVKADLLLAEKEPQEAANVLAKARDEARDANQKMELSTRLAGVLAQMNKYPEAAALYQQIANDASQPWQRDNALRMMFSCYKSAGTLAEKTAEMEQAVQKDPGDEATLRKLLLVYLQVQPDPAKALSVLDKLIAIDSNSAELYLQRGDLRSRQDQWDGALADYTKAIQLQPERAAELRARVIQYLLANEKYDLALAWATDATKASPKDPRAWLQLALVLERAGKPQEAEATYLKAIELVSTEAEKAELRMGLAELYQRQNQIDKAVEILKDLSENGATPQIRTAAKRRLLALYEEKGMLDKIQFGK